MDDRFNTIAGWALFSAIVAFGASSVSSHYFAADKSRRPDTMGYEIAGVEAEGGADEAKPIEFYLASADLAKGENSFKKCTSCHTVNAGGANGIGPNLHGVMGKPIGGHAGFAFTDALKSHGGNWDWANMSDWLQNPRKFAPGTKMTFAGLSDPQERANLIAWMNAQGSNLPVPPPPAAAPEADAPEGGEGVTAPAAAGAAQSPAEAGAAAQPAPGTEPQPQQDKSTVGVTTTVGQ